jgi:hypothetical protein
MKTTGQKKWFFLAIFAAIVLVFDMLGVLHLLSPAYGSGRLQQQVTFERNVTSISSSHSLIPSASKHYTHDSCIMTRVRDVGYLLPQWINYHRAIGMDHFYISDDCSSTRHAQETCKHFEDEGIVTFFNRLPFLNCSNHIPDGNAHFRYLFRVARQNCRWIAVIDVDEYIFPTVDTSQVRFLPELLRTAEPVIRMPWYVVSNNGTEKLRKGLIIENFVGGVFNSHVKTFARSITLSNWAFFHYPVFQDRLMSNGRNASEFANSPFTMAWELDTSVDCPVPTSPLYLKHFMTLSWEDYQVLRTRNRTSGNSPNPWAFNPREKWLHHKYLSDCSPLSESFRRDVCKILGSADWTQQLLATNHILKTEV